MTKHILIILFTFNFVSIFSQNIPIIGSWVGKLDIGYTKLRIGINIAKGDSGKLKATFDSPDQGAFGMKVKTIELKKDSLFLAFVDVRATFEGKYRTDSTCWTGKWKQSGQNLPLTLYKRKENEPYFNRPQTPKKPYNYIEEEAIVKNSKSNILLNGTLTYPKNAQNLPAIILITGSGAQDRDESIMEHKPFHVIADYFTKNGFVVLRMDDRGVGKSEGKFETATPEDFASDISAGFDWLKSRKEVNPNKIILMGHSEGGIIAPMVATQKPVTGIVLLAGVGMNLLTLLEKQTELVMKSDKADSAKIAKALKSNREIYDLCRTETDTAILAKKIKDNLKGKIPSANIETQVKMMVSPWMRYYAHYEPSETLKKVKCKVLALNGEKDVQVPTENLTLIENALKEGGNDNVEIHVFPELNHLFQKSTFGAVSEYSKIDETFNPAVLEYILIWLRKI